MSWPLALLQWMYLNVLGNLVASVIWATPAFVWQHRRLTKHHAAQTKAIHARLDLLLDGKEMANESGSSDES